MDLSIRDFIDKYKICVDIKWLNGFLFFSDNEYEVIRWFEIHNKYF